MLGRLLQRLQQSVEGLLRQHVHFVDDVDFGARRDRPVARVLDDLPHVVDAGVGGCVHLDHVDVARIHDRLAVHPELGHVDAGLIDPARNAVVQRAGENARGRRLAGAAHAGENIGLMDAARGEGIGDGPDHRLLADEVLEALRPVFSRQNAIGRRGRRERSGRRFGGKQRIAHRPLFPPRSGRSSGSIRVRRVRAGGRPDTLEKAKVGGWTKTRPVSLGLLPSGPDPVGERCVLRQPPAAYVDHGGAGRKGRRCSSFSETDSRVATIFGERGAGARRQKSCRRARSSRQVLISPRSSRGGACLRIIGISCARPILTVPGNRRTLNPVLKRRPTAGPS